MSHTPSIDVLDVFDIQECTSSDSRGHNGVVVIMSDCKQDAARELGEGTFVLVHGMGPEDAMGNVNVRGVNDVHDACCRIRLHIHVEFRDVHDIHVRCRYITTCTHVC